MGLRRPYQPFFLLAALDAVIGIAVWLPGSFMAGPTWWAGLSARDWHHDSLLFATMPAILAGFLLTVEAAVLITLVVLTSQGEIFQ